MGNSIGPNFIQGEERESEKEKLIYNFVSYCIFFIHLVGKYVNIKGKQNCREKERGKGLCIYR